MNLAILSLLVKFMHVEVLEAVTIAIEASILFNFILNHHYTFKGYGSFVIRTQRESLDLILLKMGKFNIGALGGAAISFTTFTIIFKVVHLNNLIADIVAIGMAMSWSYWVSKRFVWRAIDQDTTYPDKAIYGWLFLVKNSSNSKLRLGI